MKDWIHTKTITGSIADGERYFRREAVEQKLWREIRKGNHILFSAPRRVGKSSVMKYIADHPQEGYCCTYENISTDQNRAEFYHRVLGLIIKHVKHPKTEEWKSFFKTWGIGEAGADGIKLFRKEHDYKKELLAVLPKLKEEGQKIVLFLDEFPDVIKNIWESEGPEHAIDVLQTLRSIRHNTHFRDHFVLVLAGSVGLSHVVKEIDRPAVINDLHEQNLPALASSRLEGQTLSEAEAFIQHLIQGATMQIDDVCRGHLLQKLGQAIPYYIQLLVESCNDLLYDEERTSLTKTDIDRAWEQVLKEHKHFADADERLKDYFPTDYPYFLRVLGACAHNNLLSVQEAYDLGHDLQVGGEYKAKIDDVLIKDGYLYQEGNNFYFVSPLLQSWWKNRHPKINAK